MGAQRVAEKWKVLNNLRRNENDISRIHLISIIDWVNEYRMLPTEGSPDYRQQEKKTQTTTSRDVVKIARNGKATGHIRPCLSH